MEEEIEVATPVEVTIEESTADNFEEEKSFNNVEQEPPSSPKLNEEYDPNDTEALEETEGDYGYGWGYSNAFDNPDDQEDEIDPYDEDELYAKGIDKDKNKSKEDF